MAKYVLISYKKKKVSFLSRLNSMDNYTGVIKEPYELTLRKHVFFNMYSYIVVRDWSFPAGFDAEHELLTGREIKFL